MRNFFIFFTVFICSATAKSQTTDTTFIKQMMETKPGLFAEVLNSADHKQVQILYTQINRDANNKPSFKSYSYNLNPQHYFYPASTVKLAVAIFALEKLNELNIKGLNFASTMITDSAFVTQSKVFTDLSAKNGKPSVAQYIKKILLVSDNDAFNRLYEFVGRAEINQKLKEHGFINSRIVNRLSVGDSPESAKHTNPIRFYHCGKLVYQQPAQYDDHEYPLQLFGLKMGKGYMDRSGNLVQQPFSFENGNNFPLTDQQLLLKKLMFPEAFAKPDQFNLRSQDYKLLYKYMGMYPPESDYPNYDPKEIWPTYTKFIYFGSEQNIDLPKNIRIFNKCGDAYGYAIDNAYFVDFDKKIEFLVSVVIQSNNNQIYNDNNYEYDSICFPFLKNLGQMLYNVEINREKTYLPNLKKFKFNYK